MRFNSLIGQAVLTTCLLTGVSGTALAQSVEDFYRGKVIDLYVGAAPGGAFDIVARPLADHLGRHIPGNPTIILRHMPGGSGVVMANHLYNVAPKDGSAIGLASSNVVMEPRLLTLSPDGSGLQYDVELFNWIGSPVQEPHVTWLWHTAPADSIEDLQQTSIRLGATSPAADNAVLPWIMNELIGTRFNVTVGYDGQASISNAVERGEMEGNNTALTNLVVTHWDWVESETIKLLIQYGAERHPLLPDVPTAIELAENEEDAELLRFYALKFDMQRPLVAPPQVPEDRVEALRAAFDATMEAPEFLADFERLRIDVTPLSGEEIDELIDYIMSVPDDIPDRIRQIAQSHSQ